MGRPPLPGRGDEAFEAAQAAVAPVYDPADIVADPQFQALGTVHRIHDEDLGDMAMQGPLFRLSQDDATLRFTGRAHGADTDEVLGELGFSDTDRIRMRAEGSIA